MENITVSIPKRLVAVVEQIKREKNINRSKVIVQCLEDMARRRKRKLMEEGYKAMAKEQEQIARVSFDVQSEIVPEW